MPDGTMEIIPPIDITDAMLTSSDVPENDESEWLVGTSYTVGQKVMVTDVGVHKIYECMVANTGNYPPDNIYDATVDPATGAWKEISATNRWKMFDHKTKSSTSQVGTITTEITPAEIYNSVAAFGIVADSVNVLMLVGTDVVYDVDVDMIDLSEIDSYYSWFFEDLSSRQRFILTDLPAYSDGILTITADNGADTCEVGELIVGKYINVGITEYGTNLGIIDYSRKTVDDATGAISVEKRTYANTVEYGILVETSRVNLIKKILSSYVSTPMVFIGDEELPETIIYGFFNDFTIELQNINKSSCNLQAEEL